MQKSIDKTEKGQVVMSFVSENKRDSKKLARLHKALDGIVAETQAIGVFATTVIAGKQIDQFQITIPIPVG